MKSKIKISIIIIGIIVAAYCTFTTIINQQKFGERSLLSQLNAPGTAISFDALNPMK